MRETRHLHLTLNKAKLGQQNPNCTKRYSATLIFFWSFLKLQIQTNFKKLCTTREKNVNQQGEIQEIKAKDFFKRFQK